jgi:hypothetical protein
MKERVIAGGHLLCSLYQYAHVQQMIIPFLAAGIILLVAFIIHFIGGTKMYMFIRPSKDKKDFIPWAMGAATFQMVTVDLLLTGIFALMLGLELIEYNLYLALFITVLYAGYLVVWLATLASQRVKMSFYKSLGQWTIFLAVLALMGCGIMLQ